MAESQPSGVRLVFRTRATEVELDTLRAVATYAGMPARPDCFYDLLVDGELAAQATQPEGDVVETDLATGGARPGAGGRARSGSSGCPTATRRSSCGCRGARPRTWSSCAPTHRSSRPPTGRRVWLHHGSSISQGSIAASPSTTWPALAAARGGVDLVNLGLAGSALLDPFTARAMRDTPADLLSVKIGINLVNHDLMRLRAFGPAVHGFLDTLREGHPDAPLLVVSPLLCPIHEETPGPGTFDADALGGGHRPFRALGDPADVAAGALTLQVIREELRRIVAAAVRRRPGLHYLDGLELYGAADHDRLPLPDDLHPDADAHVLIAERFAAAAFGPGAPFGVE